MKNNNDTPLVSVIIPVYKVEEFIHECIDSVINQTYKNIEIILVDDSSPDNCPQICDDYAKKDPRIRVIHKENSGLSDSRNVGLNISSGEYVYFLDSDDYIEKDAIETLLSEARYHSADVVFFDARVIGNINNPSYPVDIYLRKELYANPLKGIDMLSKLLRYREYRAAVYLYFIRKNILEKNQLFFYSGIIHEDELFTYKLFLYSKTIVHLPEALHNRRIRENSIMNSRRGKHHFNSMLTVVDEMINSYLVEAKSDNDKNVISMHINKILMSTKNRYYQLPIKDRVFLNKKIKDLQNKLEENNYLNSQEIKKQCMSMGVTDFKREIKRILPKKIKMLIKKHILIEDVPYLNNTLNSLKKTAGNKRIILIGTPIHGNLGDHAIAIAERQLIAEYAKDFELIEITMPVYRAKSKAIKHFVTKNDFLIISGGGWLGTIWKHNEDAVRSALIYFPDNRILIMPQTIYFDESKEGMVEKEKSKKIFSSHENLTICLRDLKSYNFVLNNNFVKDKTKCFYVPDVALAFDCNIEKQSRKGALLCFRQDRENVMDFMDRRKIKNSLRKIGLKTNYTTTVYLHQILLDERTKAVDEKLREYAGSRIVVTDRLHSMIFAAITGTPCIAFDNKTAKVKGVYNWIKDLEYIRFVSSVDEAISVMPFLLEKGAGNFVKNDVKKHFYKVILEVIGKENL
jgi:pyruvyl transferase EpsI